MVEKLSVEIALEGGEALQQQFAAATSSIAKLGNTAEEAFAGAAAAAQRFSASTAELGRVEGIISALAARAKDSGFSFSELAANYDRARQSADTFVAASTKVEQALKTTRNAAGQTRAAVAALAQGLNVMGAGPAGRAATAIANIGTRLGAIALVGAAVGGTTAAMIKFASAAEETGKALTQLQTVSQQSFSNLSALSNAFAKGGTPLKQFATEFGNLSEKIASAGEQAAKQDAIAKQAEDAAKGLKVTELGAITLEERVKVLLETLSRVPPTEQWFRLADIFKSLGSDAERARIGKALGLSPESIATLSQGSAKLQEMAQKAQQLGLALDAVDQKNLQGMIESQNQASSLFDSLKAKMGALVAPAITSFWEGFTQRIQELVPVFTQIASSIGQIDFSAVGAAAANFLAVLAKIGIGWAQILSGNVSFGAVFGQLLQEAGQLLGSMAVQIGGGIGQGIISGIISAIQSSFGIAASAAGEFFTRIGGGFVLMGQQLADFASQIAGITWDSISGAGVAAWNAIVTAIQGAGTAVTDFVSSLAGITWDAISGAGVAAWNAITGAITDAINALLKFIGLKASAPATGGGAPGKASGGLLGGRGTGTSDSNLAWLSRGEYIMPARVVRQPGVASFLEALRRGGGIPGFAEGGFIHGVAFGGGGGVADKISDWIVSIAGANNDARRALQQIAQNLARASDGLIGVADSLTDKLFPVVSAMTDVLNVLNRKGGNARGGLLGGRGTGTSDSNLAWVSRGEHIMPARAVAQPGVLAFLEALRRSGGNLADVLDGMGRFALGGMVPRAIPAFATGGLNGGMSNVTIQFPGLPDIGGLRASSSAVDELRKAAALAQVRSGGRKPSRYS